jgi:hypothetical protein
LGLYVHLSVIFPCDRNEGVARLAEKHAALVPEGAPDERFHFLRDLCGREGENFGPKGGVSTWGIIGNYTSADAFVQSLSAFWEDLLGQDGDDWHGPLPQNRVVVFYEVEQSERAKCYEIGWDDPFSSERKMCYWHHEDLPFSWRM